MKCCRMVTKWEHQTISIDVSWEVQHRIRARAVFENFTDTAGECRHALCAAAADITSEICVLSSLFIAPKT